MPNTTRRLVILAFRFYSSPSPAGAAALLTTFAIAQGLSDPRCPSPGALAMGHCYQGGAPSGRFRPRPPGCMRRGPGHRSAGEGRHEFFACEKFWTFRYSGQHDDLDCFKTPICSGPKTSAARPANIAILSPHWLTISGASDPDYLPTNPHYLPTARKHPGRPTLFANGRRPTWADPRPGAGRATGGIGSALTGAWPIAIRRPRDVRSSLYPSDTGKHGLSLAQRVFRPRAVRAGVLKWGAVQAGWDGGDGSE
jgi:hypothetical protein